MKKRLLYVLDYFHPHKGGVETVFGHITEHFSENYDVLVLTSRFDNVLPQYEERGSISIVRTCSGRLTFMLFGWFFACLYFWKHNIRFDLIHTSTYGGAIPGRFLSILYKKPVILTIHEVFGRLWFRYKGFFAGLLYRFIEFVIFCLPFDYYHSVSLFTFNTVRILYGVPDKKHCMIYNGVDNVFWAPESVSDEAKTNLRHKLGLKDRYIVLYYGHSGVSKGLDLLVAALPFIAQKYPDILVVFNLIPANRDAFIKERIRSMNTYGNVRLYDGFPLEELRTLVATSNVVVAPSLSEGFGSVHAEVSALGQNLITTHYASIPEVVSGNVLFLPSWDIDSLLDAIGKMYSAYKNPITPKRFDRQDTFKQLYTLYNLFM